MKSVIILTFFLFFGCTLIAQDLRFSYQVVNPGPTQSKLIVKVQKATAGAENIVSFNYGFYYKSAEATIFGLPANFSGNLSVSQLNACLDLSYANSLGWVTSGNYTGVVNIISPPLPPGVPTGYDRLFIGQLIDGDNVGSDIGTSATNIIALSLDNTPGGDPISQDSAYMGASDTNSAWKYGNTFFEEFDIITTSTRHQPLPIVLLSFEASKFDNSSSLLNWTTSSEQNSSHFQIQRSYDKQLWFNVGETKAAGYSTEIKNYSFTDYQVYNGRDARLQVYYRLNMVDIDGRQKYSNIETVVFGNSITTGKEFLVYPNPASDGVQVEWDANAVEQPTAIEFYDITGKLIHSTVVSDQTNQQYVDFRPTGIHSGLYLMRIMSGEEAIEHKQIVVGRSQ